MLVLLQVCVDEPLCKAASTGIVSSWLCFCALSVSVIEFCRGLACPREAQFGKQLLESRFTLVTL